MREENCDQNILCEKIFLKTDKSNIRKGGFILTHSLMRYHMLQGRLRSQNGKPMVILYHQPRSRERDECCLLGGLIQSVTLAYGTMPTTFRVSLTSSIKCLWKHCQRHSQRCVCQGIPNPVRLTVKIDHGSLHMTVLPLCLLMSLAPSNMDSCYEIHDPFERPQTQSGL